MPELKPYPFCGGEARMIKRQTKFGHWPSGGTWYVHCTACLITTQPRNQASTVIEIWNRRQLHNGKDEALPVVRRNG